MSSRGARSRVASLALAGLALILAACSGGHQPDPSPTAALLTPAATPMTVEVAAARGPFGVGGTTIELVDSTRGTAANRDAPALSQRTLVVEVWYPAAPVTAEEQRDATLAAGGPFPLIIFAHGFTSIRRQSASYTQHLASHGYVVASPDFPQSWINTPGGPRLSAVLDQPADVSFVIDQLLERSAAAGSPLSGAIDPEHIGMTGHSLGGLTAMLAAYGERSDARIDAIVPISPPGCVLPPGPADRRVPAMIVGGSMERIVDPASIRQAYEAASTPKYYVEVIGADHIRFGDFGLSDEALGTGLVDRISRGDLRADAEKLIEATGADPEACEDGAGNNDELITADRQRELLRTVALPFFNAYLRDDEAARAFLASTLPALEGLRVETEPE